MKSKSFNYYCCSLFVIGLFFVLTGAGAIPESAPPPKVKHTVAAHPDLEGIWNRYVTWKARWVKYWQPQMIYQPVWKRVWGPLLQKEWVPLPNG